MVRCLMYWDSNTETIKTASRGGKNYDAATTHIRGDQQLIDVFRKKPDLVLDGEIYRHGKSLQSISGACRLKEYDEERCGDLKFNCYDLAIEKLDFQKRLEIIERLGNHLIDNKHIIFVEHTEIHGYEDAKIKHDAWVAEGYEGAILRDPTKEYGFGKRDIRMIKLKEFSDDEFEIVGYELGLRGSEDMVFKLKTKNNVFFEAKPIGDRALKAAYVKDIDNIIGKQGTVKYMYITEDGVPFHPTFKCIRDYE